MNAGSESPQQKLDAVRALAEALGDRQDEPAPQPSGKPVTIAPTDRRVVAPLRRMLLEILDRP